MTTNPSPGAAVLDGPQERYTVRQLAADAGPGAIGPRTQPRRQRAQARSGSGRGPRWEILPRPGGGAVVVGSMTRPRRSAAAPRGARWNRTPHLMRARLTGRGRVVLCLGLLMLMVAAFAMGRLTSAAASAEAEGAMSTVVVQPGQSLWEIAGQVAPGDDRRATMQRLDRLNPGSATGLRPGQVLRVPA